MAILAQLPGVVITIEVDGQTAAEYDDLDESTSTNTQLPTNICYIESKTGVRFAIKALVTSRIEIPASKHLYLRVSIDGVTIGCWLAPKLGRPLFISQVCGCADVPGKVKLHDFTFAQTTTTDETQPKSGMNDSQSSTSVGSIAVEVISCTRSVVTAALPARPTWSTVTEHKLHAVKGQEITHGTSFPSSESVDVPKKVDYLANVEVVGHLKFKYRSHRALQNLMVIPHSPGPPTIVPELVEISDDDLESVIKSSVPELNGLSEAEVRRLAAEMLNIKKRDQQRKTQDGVVRLKRQRSEDADDHDPAGISQRPRRPKVESTGTN